ncbi:nucleotide sugar dehydrogenase, partial [Gammaproteobacteria bacterium]|nr:nucleotide sugar dehydrogenase [Gammaproteobacteria bacterium]
VTVVGSGYVGMSLSVLLAQHNDVTILDIDAARVDAINNRQSTVSDTEIELFLAEKPLFLTATLDKEVAYQDALFVIIATPTNYDADTNCFDTSSVDAVVGDALRLNNEALVVIKSTIPVGHTRSLQEQFETDRVIFSPEFLREGQALKDNLYPSRIVVGSQCKAGVEFSELLKQGAKKLNIETLFIRSTEAEAVKLFANTYLAMRVSFFNELDSYALANELDTKSIIDGVCLDERIGAGYNNPSFGYGGYCLPKDTKQLLANYGDVPQKLIQAIVSSNTTRKDFMVDEILKKNPKTVGFYRLVMKEGSDNFRSSAIQDIIASVVKGGVNVLIYEPTLREARFTGFEVSKSLQEFKSKSDVVVSNRFAEELLDIECKVITRDVFGNN